MGQVQEVIVVKKLKLQSFFSVENKQLCTLVVF